MVMEAIGAQRAQERRREQERLRRDDELPGVRWASRVREERAIVPPAL